MFLLLCIHYFLIITCDGLRVESHNSSTLSTQSIQVNLDGLRFEKNSFDPLKPVVIHYIVNEFDSLDALTFSWKHDGKELDVAMGSETSSDAYMTKNVNPNGNQIYIDLHLIRNASPILPTFPKPKRVLEGDDARIVCQVKAYPRSKPVIWKFKQVPVNMIEDGNTLIKARENLQLLAVNSSRFVFETSVDGTENDTLRFTNISPLDNGIYQCEASNGGGSDSTIIIINVKGRWAAFWPFLGIIVEVTVLVIAILAYERHQMRSSQEPNKVDQGHTTDKTEPNAVNAVQPNEEDADDRPTGADDVHQRGQVNC